MKRQIRRIKEHRKKKSDQFANCQSGGRCIEKYREDLPELSSPGFNPPASRGQATEKTGSAFVNSSHGDNPSESGGQATERSGSAFVNSQSERYNAFEKTSPGKGKATERSGSAVFVKIDMDGGIDIRAITTEGEREPKLQKLLIVTSHSRSRSR